MKIIYRVLSLALLLGVFLGARANNKVTISSTEGAPGEEVTVSVGLDNTDEVSSFQVVIPIDDNVTLVENSAVAGSRCSGHTVVAGVKNGAISVLVYSLTMTAFTGNSGEVVSFKLKLGSKPHTTVLTPSQVVVTNPSGGDVNCDVEAGEVTSKCAKAVLSTMEIDYGSVPIRSTYTENVVVANEGNIDLVISSLVFSDPSVFSSTMTLPATLAPGESQTISIVYNPIERGAISKTMKVMSNSVSKLNTVTLKAQPFAVNEIHVNPASGSSDEEVTVTISMNNMDPVSGLQLEFDMPEALIYVDGSFVLSSRKEDHQLISSMNNGKLCALAYSPTDTPFKDNDGEICSFKVKLNGRNTADLTPSNVVLSATIGNRVENVVSASYGTTVSISNPMISVNETLDFGAVSVTDRAEKAIVISNNGSAPLIISRVVSDNEKLTIKETLPLTIDPWQIGQLTVVYNSIEQVDFSGTLSIYSNDPDKRMCNVAVSGSHFAPNYISFACDNLAPQDDLVIDVNIDTYDDINGIQFDLEYPSQYFEPFENNVVLSDNANGMTVTTRDIGDGVIRYFCYFISGGNIPHGSGKIMSITFNRKNEESPIGTYSINVTNIKMGTSELENKYAGEDISIAFMVTTSNPVTITALDASREYGEDNPTFGYTSVGSDVEGEPTFSCDATTTSPVGTYPIVISAGSVTNNPVTLVNGTLTVTKAPLTVIAGTYTITDGDAIPEFTVSFSGFKNDETSSVFTSQPVITCNATVDSGPGDYVITISGTTAGNYDITHVNGKLVIEARLCESITLSASTLTIKEGESNTLTATVLPVNATSRTINWSSSDESVATVADGVIIAIAPGNATITATTTDGSNLSATCEVTVEKLSDGIIGINYDNNNNKVYLLNGMRVGKNIDTKQLPDGIYIINGKQIVVNKKK